MPKPPRARLPSDGVTAISGAWDGLNDKGEKVPSGSYKISATSVMGGEAAAAKTLSFGMVAGVTPGSGGAKLDVGKLGAFNLADVKQVM